MLVGSTTGRSSHESVVEEAMPCTDSKWHLPRARKGVPHLRQTRLDSSITKLLEKKPSGRRDVADII